MGVSGPGAAEQSRKCQGVLFCDGEKTPSLGDTAMSGLGLHRISGGCVLDGLRPGLSLNSGGSGARRGGSAPILGPQGDPGSPPPPSGTFLVHV